MHRELPVQCAV